MTLENTVESRVTKTTYKSIKREINFVIKNCHRYVYHRVVETPRVKRQTDTNLYLCM